MFALSIIFPLAITLVIETGLYMILKHRDLKLFLVVSLMNVVLNPTMNLILIQFGGTQLKYWLILGIGEVSTTLIESLIVFLFMRFKYLEILLFAFIANAASFLIGLALQPLFENRVLLIIVSIVLLLGYIAMYLVVLLPAIKKNMSNQS